MIKLGRSRIFQREMRQDDVPDLAIPTWTLVSKAIQAGRTNEALQFLEYCRAENERHKDSHMSLIDMALTHLASFGEEEIEKFHRQRYYPMARNWVSAKPTVEETLQWWTEFMRSHHGRTIVVEESDRYVLTEDPCGTGGQLRRMKSVGATKKGYPWSWGRSGIPYYCAHCCLMWEIIPIELVGYPLRITLLGDRPEDPCVGFFYKKQELIPEEYFARVGKTKTIK